MINTGNNENIAYTKSVLEKVIFSFLNKEGLANYEKLLSHLMQNEAVKKLAPIEPNLLDSVIENFTMSFGN